MKSYILFINYDADGAGNDVRCVVAVDGEITREDEKKLQEEVNKVKKENSEWNFDYVVVKVCNRVFGENNIKFQYIGYSAVVEL